VAPDENFLNYLLYATQDPDVNAGSEGYAEFVRHALLNTVQRGPPVKRPNESDYVKTFRSRFLMQSSHYFTRTFRSMKRTGVSVYLLDGTCVRMHVNPWDQSSLLLDDVIDFLKLTDDSHLALYELKDGIFTRIESNESVLDFISSWPDDADEKTDGTQTLSKKKKWNFFSTLSASKMNTMMKPKMKPCFVILKRLSCPPHGESADPAHRKLMAIQMVTGF